ncbi:MAG: polysaccharide biosynthesis/export family protein [Filimonas sp.]|nr:polysaccharide biosynthesis/export family protein [Filimonas sp.]
MKNSFIALLVCICITGMLLTSCTSTKQLRYFNDLPDSAVVNLPPMEQQQRIIQKGDMLQITIGAANPEAAAMFNTYGGVLSSGASAGGGGGGNASGEVAGFLVDANGQVQFPIIGKVNAVGLTTLQMRDSLTSLVSPYLKEPLVNVKFFNMKFTVLGEVRTPGTFTIPLQRTTLLDALGAAGDLPRTARRYDIQIYRDYNGKRQIAKLDLRKKDILNNPDLFQIKHNDVVIVQPRGIKLFDDESRLYLSALTLLVSVGVLLVTILK